VRMCWFERMCLCIPPTSDEQLLIYSTYLPLYTSRAYLYVAPEKNSVIGIVAKVFIDFVVGKSCSYMLCQINADILFKFLLHKESQCIMVSTKIISSTTIGTTLVIRNVS